MPPLYERIWISWTDISIHDCWNDASDTYRQMIPFRYNFRVSFLNKYRTAGQPRDNTVARFELDQVGMRHLQSDRLSVFIFLKYN